MKNRILVFVVVFIAVETFGLMAISAQEAPKNLISFFDAQRTNYIDVVSYSGLLSPGQFRVWTKIHGEAEDYRDWSISVKAIDLIKNSENKEIDLSKVSIQLGRIEVGPSLGNLLYTKKPLSLENQEIVKGMASNAPLVPPSGNFVQWLFHFDIIIAPGAYLKPLRSWHNYRLALEFEMKMSDGTTLKSNADVEMRINPNISGDTPLEDLDFGFEVSADASLNFNVPEDYTRKVESSEDSWLKVTSKDKGYTVNVQTSDSYFEGESDIPVDVVSMQVEDKKGSRTGPEIALKNSGQTVFNGNATGSEPRKLDVRYFISPENAKGLAIYKPGNYVTRLTYTLLPQ